MKRLFFLIMCFGPSVHGAHFISLFIDSKPVDLVQKTAGSNFLKNQRGSGMYFYNVLSDTGDEYYGSRDTHLYFPSGSVKFKLFKPNERMVLEYRGDIGQTVRARLILYKEDQDGWHEVNKWGWKVSEKFTKKNPNCFWMSNQYWGIYLKTTGTEIINGTTHVTDYSFDQSKGRHGIEHRNCGK